MTEAGKRPFWMHQLVEYILGGALVASGLQSRTPVVPAVLGGVIMLHSAITKGALAAFRVIDRKLHRSLDPVVIALCAFGALQPWISVDNGTRVIILGIAAVHLVVFFGSSFQERTKTAKQARQQGAAAKGTDRSTDIGRTAGRVVGNGVNAVRKMRR